MRLLSLIILLMLPSFCLAQIQDYNKAIKLFERKMPGYVYIPGKQVYSDGFFLSKNEITNLDYFEFIFQKKHKLEYPEYQKLLPDTNLWLKVPGYGKEMQENYFRSSAYHDYPVVCVSYKQANAYCLWLDSILNSKPDLIFAKYEVSLPTKAEWLRAARSKDSSSVFPWEGNSLRNNKGNYKARFNYIEQSDIMIDKSGRLYITNEENYLPYPKRSMTKVHTFEFGFFGLTNMAGNAAEFVKEKGITKGGSWIDAGYYLRNSAEKTYTDSGASVANGFRVVVKIVSVNKN